MRIAALRIRKLCFKGRVVDIEMLEAMAQLIFDLECFFKIIHYQVCRQRIPRSADSPGMYVMDILHAFDAKGGLPYLLQVYIQGHAVKAQP
jgi:hypothetical protein